MLKESEASDGSVEKVVKLRNPWGKGEYKGEWAKKSSKWTESLRKEIGIGAVDDGLFCMPFDAFLKYFNTYDICYFHDNYIHSAKKVRGAQDSPTLMQFSVTKPGFYYLTVHQPNSRAFRKEESKLR